MSSPDHVKLPFCPKRLMMLIPVGAAATFLFRPTFSVIPKALRTLGLPWMGNVALGVPLIGSALFIIKSAQKELKKADTSPYPDQPTKAVVTTGSFGFTRNPLYVSLGLLFLGTGFLLDSAYLLGLWAPCYCYIRFCVIPREEKYLENKFGDGYKRYKEKVPRWLF